MWVRCVALGQHPVSAATSISITCVLLSVLHHFFLMKTMIVVSNLASIRMSECTMSCESHFNFLTAFHSDCGELNPPQGGTLTYSNFQFNGSVATYACNEGLQLVGPSTRVCSFTTGWDGDDPTCGE